MQSQALPLVQAGPAPDRPGNRRCAFPWQLMVIDVQGEVMPCAYYHFSSANQARGNTTRNSRDEIWNGPESQALRARHVAGDLEGPPCGSCVGSRIRGGQYPPFSWGDS